MNQPSPGTDASDPSAILKARAALAGMSLSDYLLDEIRRVAQRPTIDELRKRLEHRAAVTPAVPPSQAVREERDSR